MVRFQWKRVWYRSDIAFYWTRIIPMEIILAQQAKAYPLMLLKHLYEFATNS